MTDVTDGITIVIEILIKALLYSDEAELKT